MPDGKPDAEHRFTDSMSMLRIADIDELEHGLTVNKWGIGEPSRFGRDSAPRQDALDNETGGEGLDLIIAPGLAFDRTGHRLGHGKAYYDEYIRMAHMYARIHALDTPTVLALALREQIVDQVPVEQHDVPIDVLISPDGILKDSQ